MDQSSRLRLFVAFAVVSVVTRVLLLVAPPLSDEPMHLLGSWQLLQGGRLYVDFVDNKPPLLYAYYALAQWPFGRGIVPVRLLTVLACIPLTALAGVVFFRGERSGITAGALYLLTGASFILDEGLSVNTEVLMLLPAAWAFVAMRRIPARRNGAAFAAGLLLGIASLFKITALFWMPAVPLFAWKVAPPAARWPASARATAAAAVGLAIPLTAVVALLASENAAASAFDWTVVRNLTYISAPIGFEEALRRAFLGVGGWAACTLPLWWAAWSRGGVGEDAPANWLARLLVLLAVPAALLGLRFFAHYYLQVLFPLCLAAGPVAARWISWPVQRPARVAVAWLGVFFVAFAVANTWLVFGRSVSIQSKRPMYADVTAWLAHDACSQHGTLFVWGLQPMFYVDSGLRPASRFVLLQQTITGYVPGRFASMTNPRLASTDGRDWDLLMEDLERNRATFILDTAFGDAHYWGQFPLAAFDRLSVYVRTYYDEAAVVDRIVIYRRKDCLAHPALAPRPER